MELQPQGHLILIVNVEVEIDEINLILMFTSSSERDENDGRVENHGRSENYGGGPRHFLPSPSAAPQTPQPSPPPHTPSLPLKPPLHFICPTPTTSLSIHRLGPHKPTLNCPKYLAPTQTRTLYRGFEAPPPLVARRPNSCNPCDLTNPSPHHERHRQSDFTDIDELLVRFNNRTNPIDLL
ncbi:hypothetical protein Acr_01g0009030 [Actinidia rufa]|uniref:Uncharacterized protein n=1 Tax=Actinidia rufa TaxID=165716 RepID=A0A7J0E3L8_9ERIC|nr:hypothetical protein Acr_01g0009030 [Actinidia rufa]